MSAKATDSSPTEIRLVVAINTAIDAAKDVASAVERQPELISESERESVFLAFRSLGRCAYHVADTLERGRK